MPTKTLPQIDIGINENDRKEISKGLSKKRTLDRSIRCYTV